MQPPLENPAANCAACEKLLEFLYLTPIGIVQCQSCGTINLANPVAAQLLMPLAQGRDLANIYETLHDLVPNLRNLIESFASPSGQICNQMQLPVPQTHTVLALGVNKINPSSFMLVIEDISQAIEQNERIREDQQRLSAIFENIRDYAIFIVDNAGRLEGWNRSLQRVVGWDRGDLLGASVRVFFSAGPEGADRVASLLDRAREGGSAEVEGWVYRRDGSAFWGSTVATVLPDRDGHPHGFVFVTRDLTERKRTEDELVSMATTDPLTGAQNRRAGEEALATVFKQWEQSSRSFALIMIDIDHFKAVNDLWGHDFGDAVLMWLTSVFRDKLRDNDMVARWGGEEFLLLLPGADREAAHAIAERLRAGIEAADVAHSTERIRVTVSLGVAVAADSDNGPADVIKRADKALYVAKRGGRNRVVAG